ncbi:MAG: hypothetical protein JOZ85_10200, partial [Betaproteobacteria bacterium]|nr:hypothetical protein [Betaproteobacteria bacterium]
MKRAFRYGAWVVIALALLIIAVAVAVPRLLDRPKMAEQLQARLSAAIGGEVRWEEFSVRLLPVPHGEVRRLKVQTAAATLTADEVTTALRLWPLFHGSAEISSLTLVRPVVRLTIVPAASVPEEAQLAPAPTSVLESYASTMKAIVAALEEFAPDTVVAVDNADVSVRVEGMPPIEVNKLVLRARTNDHGVELSASAASRYWNALKLAARIEYTDLSSSAELQLARIQGKPWLDWFLKPSGIDLAVPDVDLNLRFRGDAKKALELDLDGTAKTLTLVRAGKRIDASPIVLKAKVIADASDVAVQVAKVGAGASALAGGGLSYTPKEKSVAGDVGYDLDLIQALGYARQFAPEPLARLESLSGKLNGRIKVAMRGDDLKLAVTIDKSDAAAQVKDLPGPIRLTGAAVNTDRRSVNAERVAVSMPAGELTVSNARYVLKDGSATAGARFDLGLAPALDLVRAAMPAESRGSLDVIQSADGRMQGTVKGTLSGKNWTAALDLAKSDARVQMKGLPGPATLTGASVRATPKAVTVDRVAAKFLDLSATATATITDYTGGDRLRVQGTVSEASIGPKLLAWVWRTAEIPANIEPKTPIRLAVQEFGWGPKSPLALRADARFESGSIVSVDLGWSPQALDLRRAAIKDRFSDVSVAMRTKGAVIEGTYDGTLDSRSISGMLKTAAAPAGAIKGEVRFLIDREQRSRTAAKGELKGEGVDLSWLAGKPAKVERIDIVGDGSTLHIREASVDWAGQRATLSGEARHGANGPVITAQVESPGILVDALLPPAKSEAPVKPADKAPTLPNIWPLPVTGKITVRSSFVQYEKYKVQPLAANFVLEENKATLDV